MPRPGRAERRVAAAVLLLAAAAAGAGEPAAVRPAIAANRWQEDWSVLAGASLRDEPLDGLKYIRLGGDGAARWLSLGATLRERWESNGAPVVARGGARDDWRLQRLQLHADLHLDAGLRVFVQLEDDRAPGKRGAGAVDRDPLDLRVAFVESVRSGGLGTLKLRAGRQDFAFDLQRFVSSRDGPNVRQSFDALWADWERADWRLIGFASQPVQYRDGRPFDDDATGRARFDMLRLERHVLGTNELSAYVAHYERESARFGDAAGHERRRVADVRFAGVAQAADWDAELMWQGGSVGGKAIRAWAVGSRLGWTAALPGRPRAGLQLDAASGDRRAGDGREETFNPLFPNGYYFNLAGTTGYANVAQVKPSLTLHPGEGTSVLLAEGLLWRATAADAVYTQPNVAVAGTAGTGSRWTGRYTQLRIDRPLGRHLAAALEAVQYAAGDTLRAAGGRDDRYLGLELKASW
jgi:hypothetical protein